MIKDHMVCGIVGGMGPMATVDFFEKLIASTKAENDSEHMRILIDNDPTIPDRTAAILGEGPSPRNQLIDNARRLESFGADFIVIPCNTSHFFYDDIAAALNIPVLHMPDLVARELAESGIKKAGLLATAGTVKSSIYERSLDKEHIDTVLPDNDQEKAVMDLIYRDIKGGALDLEAFKDPKTPRTTLAPVLSVIEDMRSQGAEAIILGCTELPIVLNTENTGILCIDATEVLARSAVRFAGYEVK